MEKPFSQACENNKGPILAVLKGAFRDAVEVLEVGSGTGQHAVHFARHLPRLRWQPTDLAGNLPGMRLWLDEARLAGIRDPIVLDVVDLPWPVEPVDAAFSANTLHIMGKPAVECFFEGMASALAARGTLCVYGPFNYGGRHTSESNELFDRFLSQQDPGSALRDFEWVNSLAEGAGLELVEDHTMPSNNRLLQWRKSG